MFTLRLVDNAAGAGKTTRRAQHAHLPARSGGTPGARRTLSFSPYASLVALRSLPAAALDRAAAHAYAAHRLDTFCGGFKVTP